MNQDNDKFNTELNGEEFLGERRKRNKVFDIVLWVLIVVLAIAVVIRAFVVSKVTVSGDSMTSAYYGLESSEHYKPALTYHHGDTVTVNKLKQPKRGDVVVFYKKPVKSKFLGMFARGDSIEQDGKYYKLIKRVVALGGDKIWLEPLGEGQYRLVIQTPEGQTLHEDYYQKNGETLDADCFILYSATVSGVKSGLGCLKDCFEQNPLVIEEGHFFAMGDNRVNSDDSRGDLGPVPISQLFGVVA